MSPSLSKTTSLWEQSVYVSHQLRLFSVLAVTFFLTSCIMFPIGGGEPHPFGERRLAFIETGVTLSADVRRELGQPTICCNGTWWIYRGTRKGSDWIVIAGGAYVADAMTVEGGTTSYHLLVGFQINGTVWRYGVLKGDEPCDFRRGICYQNGKIFVEIDPDEAPANDPNCGVRYKIGDRELFGCVYQSS